MNFNLVEMYNGLLRFNKHILNELAEGLKHLPNLDGVSKGDSLIINEQGNPAWGSTAFIPTFENAAYGIEWTKDDNDIIRIGNAKFHRELPIQNRLKGCVYNEKKISYFLNPTGWAKPLENGFVPPLDGSDGDVGVRVPEFYMCVKDTGTKYQHKVGTNKKADYNWIRGNNGQDTDKAVRVLLLDGYADSSSAAGSDDFASSLVRSDSGANVGFFTTVKLD
nr:MAG: hypothetical protein [Bacteriophage sp.]